MPFDGPAGAATLDPLEQSLIGRMLQDPAIIDQAQVDGLRPIHWREGFGRDCFAALVALRVSGELSATGVLEHLRKREEHSPALETWLTHGCALPWDHKPSEAIELIRQRFDFRQLELIGKRMHEVARTRTASAAVVIDQTLTALARLNRNGADESAGDVHETLCELVEQFENGTSDNEWSTGFSVLDGWLNGGFAPGELCILAASSGVGKSSMAKTWLRHQLQQGRAAAFWSLEMPKRQVMRRLISQETRVPLTNLKRGRRALSQYDWTKISAALADFDSPRFRLFDEPGVTAADVRAQAIPLTMKRPTMLIVDQLDIMSHGSTRGRADLDIRETSKALKNLAKSMAVPVILIHQLSKDAAKRQADGTVGKLGLGDLRDSAVENDADQVIFIERPQHFLKDKTPEEFMGRARISVQKNRDGQSGAFWCDFKGPCASFIEGADDDRH